MPGSPEELRTVEAQITSIEARFASVLTHAQINLLSRKKQQLADIQKQKTQEAVHWLEKLANDYKTGTKPDEMLIRMQTLPAFLSEQDLTRLEQLKQSLQKAIEQNALLKIESLFKTLSPEARRECLRLLQALMDKL